MVNIETDEITQIELSQSYRNEGHRMVGDIIYAVRNDSRAMYKIDVSDLTNVTETEHQLFPGSRTIVLLHEH